MEKVLSLYTLAKDAAERADVRALTDAASQGGKSATDSALIAIQAVRNMLQSMED